MCIPVPVSFEMRGSLVLYAIDFDDQPLREADEVDNVALDRRLSAEVIAAMFQFPQFIPKSRFCDGHSFAKRTRNLVCHDTRTVILVVARGGEGERRWRAAGGHGSTSLHRAIPLPLAGRG